MRSASTSLRGALTEAQPRYVSWLNTTLSSSGIGLMGLPSDEDSSAVTQNNQERALESSWTLLKLRARGAAGDDLLVVDSFSSHIVKLLSKTLFI